MVAGALGGGLAGELAQEAAPNISMGVLTQAGSAVLALAAAWFAQRAWPTLRQPRAAVAAVVLAVLSAFLPWLGACLLALADRKSTRLNSSHLVISYAVFCLK